MTKLFVFITSYILLTLIVFISMFGGISNAHEVEHPSVTPLKLEKPVQWAVLKPESTLEPYFAPNLYEWGNCTAYVASLRPDLPQNLGNASSWLYEAQIQGFKTGTEPKVNAVAWFPASGWGHVALVEAVNPDGTILITEMNVEGLGVTDYRTIPANSVSYIY